jgi:hypothetical protein
MKALRMKRVLAGLALAVATAALSGCYYDPGYSYVRPVATGGGDAYYGTGVTYSGGYYPGYYYPSYGYYGCCYGPAVSIGIGGYYGGYRGYYGGRGYYRGGGYYHGGGNYYRGGRGNWSGGHGGGGHGGWNNGGRGH